MGKGLRGKLAGRVPTVESIERAIKADTYFYRQTLSKMRLLAVRHDVGQDVRDALNALIADMHYADPVSVPETAFYEELILKTLDRMDAAGVITMDDISSLAEMIEVRKIELKNAK